MQVEEFEILLAKFKGKTITASELVRLSSESRGDDIADLINLDISDELDRSEGLHPAWTAERKSKVLSALIMEINQMPDTKVFRLNKIWWAAASVLLLVTGTWLFIDRYPATEKKLALTSEEIPPARNQATLTLSNGATILLDSVKSGPIASQGQVQVLKTANGVLGYRLENQKLASDFARYNTLTTPRGGQFQLILPDSTHVWLNAASSITYPTSFSRKDRVVNITGEAYFEVTKDKTRPFHVKVNEMDIAVLGTHFNINAFTDEPATNTTLLEGSVKLTRVGKNVILLPSQQASVLNKAVSAGHETFVLSEPDMDQVMAWKDGWFKLDNTTLQELMRQVSRWYDVDIKYEGNLKPVHFGGRISNQLPLNKLLHSLGASSKHVKYILNGKILTVTDF